MANAYFLCYKQEQLGDAAGPGHGSVDWEGATTVNAALIDTADVDPDINTHQDWADVVAALVAEGAIANRTATGASGTLTLDGDDVTLTSVSGDQAEEVVIYHDSGVDTTSLLIVRFDTFSAGMPVTPNGGDITIQWNASGICEW